MCITVQSNKQKELRRKWQKFDDKQQGQEGASQIVSQALRKSSSLHKSVVQES